MPAPAQGLPPWQLREPEQCPQTKSPLLEPDEPEREPQAQPGPQPGPVEQRARRLGLAHEL